MALQVAPATLHFPASAAQIPQLQLEVCALNGRRLERLCDRIVKHAGGQEAEQSALYCSARVAVQLTKATSMLAASIQQWQHHASPELLLADLYSIQVVLSSITGEIDNEDLLAEVFSRFCIGK